MSGLTTCNTCSKVCPEDELFDSSDGESQICESCYDIEEGLTFVCWACLKVCAENDLSESPYEGICDSCYDGGLGPTFICGSCGKDAHWDEGTDDLGNDCILCWAKAQEERARLVSLLSKKIVPICASHPDALVTAEDGSWSCPQCLREAASATMPDGGTVYCDREGRPVLLVPYIPLQISKTVLF